MAVHKREDGEDHVVQIAQRSSGSGKEITVEHRCDNGVGLYWVEFQEQASDLTGEAAE